MAQKSAFYFQHLGPMVFWPKSPGLILEHTFIITFAYLDKNTPVNDPLLFVNGIACFSSHPYYLLARRQCVVNFATR